MAPADSGDSPAPNLLLAKIERRLPEIYLILALTITTLVCFLTPPFFGPDEPDQASRAIALSHGNLIAQMGPSRGGQEAGAQIDSGAVRAMDGMDDIREAWEADAPDFLDRPYGPVADAAERPLMAIGWAGHTEFLPFGNTAGYPPVLYLPAIAGWRIAKALNLTIFQSLRLARLLGAFSSVALGWLALRLCACSGWILLPFLLLPSTLFLNACCSQDAMLLAVAALAAAVLTHPVAACRRFTPVELAAMTVLLALCATARPPYLAMAVVLFLPGIEASRAGSNSVAGGYPRTPRCNTRAGTIAPIDAAPHWFAPAVAFVAVTAATGLWLSLIAPLGLEHSNEARPELQQIFLRTHPVAACSALVRGTAYAAFDFARRGVYVTGWNDLLPHHALAPALLVCIAAIILAAPRRFIRSGAGRALLGIAFAAPLLGISLAEYIIWTPPGLRTVYGIQPRYWLPIMPLAMLLLHSTSLPRSHLAAAPRIFSQSAAQRILATAAAVLALIAGTLPVMVAHAFYRESIMQVLRINLR